MKTCHGDIRKKRMSTTCGEFDINVCRLIHDILSTGHLLTIHHRDITVNYCQGDHRMFYKIWTDRGLVTVTRVNLARD